MRKRLFLILLSLCLCVFLNACGSSSEEASVEATSEDTASTEVEETEDVAEEEISVEAEESETEAVESEPEEESVADEVTESEPEEEPVADEVTESEPEEAIEDEVSESETEITVTVTAEGLQIKEVEEEDEPEYTTYSAGTYKIGVDMPAGEYVLFANNSAGYFEVASDSSGTLDSIICNDNFSTNSIITVTDGQYLELSRCYAIPIEENPPVDITGEGMFKVGLHIKPGEYKATVSEDSYVGYGYIEVSPDSTHDIWSIVTNDNFEGSKYVTVTYGQYITVSRCSIVLSDGTDASYTDYASLEQGLTIEDLNSMLYKDFSEIQTDYPDIEVLASSTADPADWKYQLSCVYYGRPTTLYVYGNASGAYYAIITETDIADTADLIYYSQYVESEIAAVCGTATSTPTYSLEDAYVNGDENYVTYWMTSSVYVENSVYFPDFQGSGNTLMFLSGVTTREVADANS